MSLHRDASSVAAEIEGAADDLRERVMDLVELVPESEPGVRLVLRHAADGLCSVANYVAAYGVRS